MNALGLKLIIAGVFAAGALGVYIYVRSAIAERDELRVEVAQKQAAIDNYQRAASIESSSVLLLTRVFDRIDSGSRDLQDQVRGMTFTREVPAKVNEHGQAVCHDRDPRAYRVSFNAALDDTSASAPVVVSPPVQSEHVPSP